MTDIVKQGWIRKIGLLLLLAVVIAGTTLLMRLMM